MALDIWRELENDFLKWSGGFPPESTHQITVYVDYANPFAFSELHVTAYLREWMTRANNEPQAT